MSMYGAIKENRKFYLTLAALACTFYILIQYADVLTDTKFSALTDLVAWALGLFGGANVAEKIGAAMGAKKNGNEKSGNPPNNADPGPNK